MTDRVFTMIGCSIPVDSGQNICSTWWLVTLTIDRRIYCARAPRSTRAQLHQQHQQHPLHARACIRAPRARVRPTPAPAKPPAPRTAAPPTDDPSSTGRRCSAGHPSHAIWQINRCASASLYLSDNVTRSDDMQGGRRFIARSTEALLSPSVFEARRGLVIKPS